MSAETPTGKRRSPPATRARRLRIWRTAAACSAAAGCLLLVAAAAATAAHGLFVGGAAPPGPRLLRHRPLEGGPRLPRRAADSELRALRELFQDPAKVEELQASAQEMAKDPEKARAMQTWVQSVAPAIARLRADPDLEDFFQELDQDGMGALAKYEQYDWFLQKLSAAQASVSHAPKEGGSGDEGGDWLARELSAVAQAGASSEESIQERAMRELEDELIEEVFAEFDRDKDRVLSLEEFNALQRTTEGPDAAFSAEQLLSLLQNVSPALQEPERGMPFAVFYRLYSDDELVGKYNTDIVQDHGVIFGSTDARAMPSKEVPETLFGDRAVD